MEIPNKTYIYFIRAQNTEIHVSIPVPVTTEEAKSVRVWVVVQIRCGYEYSGKIFHPMLKVI